MNTKPILFSGDMIHALLDGRKTQTRRILPAWQRPKQKDGGEWVAVAQRHPRYGFVVSGKSEAECASRLSLHGVCKYGKPGDLLWVREGFRSRRVDKLPGEVAYKADHPGAATVPGSYGRSWKPSIHMPRWASRLTLRVTDVRVERVQDISEEDAKREGVEPYDVSVLNFDEYDLIDAPLKVASKPYKNGFALLWDSINADRHDKDGNLLPYAWADNPWVWVIEFEVIQQNVDGVLMEAA